MKKPTRKQVLAWIRYHASQGDLASAQRLYIENSISVDAYRDALQSKKQEKPLSGGAAEWVVSGWGNSETVGSEEKAIDEAKELLGAGCRTVTIERQGSPDKTSLPNAEEWRGQGAPPKSSDGL